MTVWLSTNTKQHTFLQKSVQYRDICFEKDAWRTEHRYYASKISHHSCFVNRVGKKLSIEHQGWEVPVHTMQPI